MQQLTDNSPQVAAQIRTRSNNMVQNRGKVLLGNLKNIDKRRALISALTTPKNFIQYSQAMKKLPLEAPDMAAGIWQNAVKEFPRYQALEAGSNLSVFATYEELEKAIAEQQINVLDNCFVKDISRLVPDKFFKERLASAIRQLGTELGALYNCYELTFVDEKGMKWHFYSAEKPILDKSRSSRIPKAIALNVMITPGAAGKFLPIRVDSRNAGKIQYHPGSFADMALPGKFVKLENFQLNSGNLPKAQHFTVLENLLKEFTRVRTPQQLANCVTGELKKLSRAENINIFARAQLTRKLLDVLALSSEFYRAAVTPAATELDKIA